MLLLTVVVLFLLDQIEMMGFYIMVRITVAMLNVKHCVLARRSGFVRSIYPAVKGWVCVALKMSNADVIAIPMWYAAIAKFQCAIFVGLFGDVQSF